MPTEQEVGCLLATNPLKDIGRSVSIIRWPGPFFGERTGESRPEEEDFEKRIFGSLHRICKMAGDVTLVGLTSNPPNLKTTTVGVSNKHIGLHVDSWQDTEPYTRDLSNNRICINVGEGPRFFLFLPVSVVEIAHIMAEEIGAENIPLRDVTELGRMFMELFPEVPVVRCRLAPNEAYVAPTENLVHDGSSEGLQHLDQQFTVLGQIMVHAP
jgi:hypothetical protein